MLPTWPNDSDDQAPSLDFRFCNFYASPDANLFWSGYDAYYDYIYSPDSLVDWSLQDCRLHGGRITLGEPTGAMPDWIYGSGAISWKNNLFDNVAIDLDPTLYEFNSVVNCDLSLDARNNLFLGGRWFRMQPIPAAAGNWVFKDNLFDKTDFIQNTNSPLDFNYNAYWPLSTSELAWDWYIYPWYEANTNQLCATTNGGGGNEQFFSTAPPYQRGPLADYYLPITTPLYHAGSRAATDAGLYHYTTRVDQTKEGSGALVNIGLHYVATTGSGSSQPKDSDGDGIPDFVENASGTGSVGPNETDWQNQYTTSGVFDPTNSVYDDIDLSGNGLVGRIKKALGVQPFDTSNPLALSPLLTGEEPDIVTFEVPVSYDAVIASGTLSLSMNGAGVTLADCTRATNGNCLLSFNADFDPAGLHYLSATFRSAAEPGSPHPASTAGGLVQPFCSSNSVQFWVNASMFDDAGAFLDAKLFVQQADYTIDLYDPSTTPRTHIMSITNSTSSGMIQEDWGTTNADGTAFTGTTVQAVFSVTPSGSANALPGKPSKVLTRPAGALSEWGPNFDVAYMYTPTNSILWSDFGNINGNPGPIWMGMIGLVDTLLMPVTTGGGHDNNYYSSFNRYTSRDFPGQPGIPGYLTSRSDVTNTLLPDLTNGFTRQFYCYAHGNSNGLANAANDVFITTGDISRALGNTYTKTNLITQKPFRFVFLDGCATASTPDWSRAFGIYPLNEAPRDKVGPQAYLGWASDHAGWLNGNVENDHTIALNIAKAYTQTLQMFYSYWMSGKSLKECIDYVSSASLYGMAPFPVPEFKKVPIYGPGYDYMLTNVLTSKIVVIGHSGLTWNGRRPDKDGYFPMPTP
ncbi:MAG: hypothetical protein WCH61_06640 [bacterium]